jgi:hypothetical protein
MFTASALGGPDRFRRNSNRAVGRVIVREPWGAMLRAARAGLLCFVVLAHAQHGERPTVGEYQVKAAFLYHFAKFIEWPAAAVKGEVLVVGVLGKDPFGPTLDFMFEDKTLRGKRFEVRRVNEVSEAQACHVLFVNLEDKAELRSVLQALSSSPVLTVGSHNLFLTSGGMIQLFVEESKVRFDISLTAAKRSGLSISAQLLRLARVVEGK